MDDVSMSANGIAIIGLAGRFPGANDVDAFWENLVNGVESSTRLDDGTLRREGVPQRLIDDPDFVKVSYVVEGAENFDAELFQFTPREAEITDPQHRMLLECCYEALDHAGYSSEDYSGHIGVYAGVGSMSYFVRNLSANPELLESVGPLRVSIGNEKSFATTMVSYKLNLRGPSVNVDTACSTSLVAIHQACQSLLSYECDIALSGGVSIDTPQKAGMLYREGSIVSPDGRCRPFDSQAKGTVKGNGAGIVVLKRLEDAVRDGDFIHAVILGSAINNDGSLKLGYTASSIDGQVEVVADALVRADVDAATIGYVETHGTGTILGDPIEVSALEKVFAGATSQGSCAIGSVKANIGHLDIAAGVAGLIKVVEALKHARIPPSINYSEPNPNIDFARGPFFVNDVLRDWTAGDAPRRAGVSSFGIGGTNAHVVVEEAPPRRSRPSSRHAHLFVLSARTRAALERQIGRMSAHFDRHPDTDLADAAYTLQIGRREYEHRAAVVVRDGVAAAAQLDPNDRRTIIAGPVRQTPKICFLFPGQGAQHPGMAKGLYDAEPDFRAVFDRCAEAFRAELGCDLREIVFSDAADGADRLDQTSLTQPALFAVEYAMAKFWEGLGVVPDAMIGHSLGEYVAACLADVMRFEDATALVAERARLMQSLPPGVMLMVPLPEADIAPYLSAECSLAAVNGPHICVLSGTGQAIAQVEARLAADGVETRRLHTSHAFHSSMMDPILDRFEQRLRRVRLSAPTRPYLSNVTGDWIRPEQATDPRYWVEHLRGTVRFGDGVGRVLDDARYVLLEVGPGQVLTTLARRSFGANETAVPSARHAQDGRPDHEVFLQALGTLWTRGCRIDWTGLYSGESRMRVPLPAYAFDRKRYWIDRDGRSASQAVAIGADIRAEPAAGSTRAGAEKTGTGPSRHVSGQTLAEGLLSVWRQSFGIEAISPEDNFFELGGDSLLATQLTAVVRDRLGVKLRLSDLFENPRFSDLLASLEAKGVDIAASIQPDTRLSRIEPDLVNRHQPFPLTDIQQAYWVGRSGAVELGDVATHIYLEVDIKHGEISRFVDAWNVLIQRHDMLRAIFLASGEQQIIERVPRYEFDVIDLEALDEQAALERQLAVRAKMSHQVLPAERWPLFDIKAIRSTQHRFRLCISIDILLVDAWSMNMLIEQWLQLYRDPALTLPPIDFSFRDYVIAEHGLQGTDLYRDSERYWFDRIESLPAAPDLPLAQSPSALTSTNFVRRMYQMDKARWSKLKQRSVAAGLTPSGLLMAAFSEVLGQWSGNPHFTINLTMYSRHPFHEQVDQIVGDFTSLTLLEIDNRTPSTFREHAERVQKQLWKDLDYRYVSAIHVLREMTRRNGSRVSMPIVFTSTLGARALEHESDALDDLGEEVFGVSQTSQVWLDHQVMEWKGQLRFNWDAVDALFPEGMIQDMFDAYCAFVERLVDEDDLWHAIAADHLLPEKHRSLFAAVNATDADYPLDLLHRQFEAQAQATPDLAAVIAHDRVLSYSELLALSQGLGHRLRDLGVARAELVGIFLDKGWEQIASVMGILAAGGAYLPIDPALPEERLAYLVENSGVTTIVTTAALRDRLAAVCERRTVVDLHGIAPAAPGTPLLDARQTLDDLAYVIYTSGSTGQPKGVMVPHRGAANTIADINRRIGLDPGDRVFGLSALNFDLSVYDVFGTLSRGAALVMPRPEDLRDPARWCESIQAHRVSVWNSVPALMQILVDHVADTGLRLEPALRAVVLSGDWIPPALPERLSALWPQTHVLGAGGPTECSIWSACHPVQPEDWRKDSIPYGKPLGNQQIHILNGQLQPCPIWVPGELYVAGDGLALGYLADPVRTDAVFLHHPKTGQRLYKSGDLGRYTPSGDIEFLGRNDFQVKINGYRVELGEVEAALKQCDAFKDVIVVAAQESGRNNKSRLVAYLVHETAGDAEAPASTAPAPAADRDQTIEIDPIHIDPIQAKLVEFKLTKPGLRPRREGETTLPLRRSPQDAAAYRRRKSYRDYLGDTLTCDRLSDMLAILSELHDDDMPLPKYRYASAGSLHAVQVYLHVKAGRVEGLEGGCYYYHPEQHALVRVGAGDALTAAQYGVGENPLTFDRAAFSLFFVGERQAITPVYGDTVGEQFLYVEAGYMAQLLMETSPSQLVGLCPIGYLGDALPGLLGLRSSQVIVHSMIGGSITRAQVDAWTDGKPAARGGATAAGASRADGEVLRERLRALLPDYMIPAAFVHLDRLPLTGNGKVDRRKLSEVGEIEKPAKTVVPPRNEIEQSLLGIWQSALNVSDISVEDNFFELGGDSVLIVRMHKQLKAQFGERVSVVDLFKYPKISALATYLSQAAAAPEPEPEPDAGGSEQIDRRKAALRRQRELAMNGVEQ